MRDPGQLTRRLAQRAAGRALAVTCSCAGNAWKLTLSRDLGVAVVRAEITNGR